MTPRFIQSLMFSAAIVCSVGSVAEAANMNYLGGWANTATYNAGSVVAHNSGIYYSLKSTRAAPNRNYAPNVNPSWWAQVGTVGNTILNGVVNPTSQGLGQVGDFYLNTVTNTLFGPKTSISPFWPANGVVLSGSGGTGVAGPAGATGATGAAGATGSAGAAGDDGQIGPAGATGSAGATGAAGATGSAGAAGADGQIGPAGVAGATGTAGAIGATPPGISVLDANGQAIGRFSSTDTLYIYRGGRPYQVFADESGFFTRDPITYPAMTSHVPGILYSELGCTGSVYLPWFGLSGSTYFFPDDTTGLAQGTSAAVGTLYYPLAPFGSVAVQSSRNAWGDCYPNFTTVFGGVVTSESVSLAVPLRVE